MNGKEVRKNMDKCVAQVSSQSKEKGEADASQVSQPPHCSFFWGGNQIEENI
jgi:hypothetical protein